MPNKPTKPEDWFRAEKQRAQSARNSQHARLLAEAKAAFDKLMAEGQAARKSGRPRKHPLPPLKTSSARIPPRPIPVEKPTVLGVQPKPPAPKANKPAASAVVKAPAKGTPGARKHSTKPAPAARPARPGRTTRRVAAKSKPKAKRSKRR